MEDGRGEGERGGGGGFATELYLPRVKYHGVWGPECVCGWGGGGLGGGGGGGGGGLVWAGIIR